MDLKWASLNEKIRVVHQLPLLALFILLSSLIVELNFFALELRVHVLI
jgi:hypothetical protein